MNLINAQQKLNLPISTLNLGLTGGSPASPQLFKNVRKYLRFEDIMVKKTKNTKNILKSTKTMCP